MKTIHSTQLWSITIAMIALLALSAAVSYADPINQYGTKSGWATSWTPIYSLNDPNDGVTAQSDFVGTVGNPGAYAANDGTYVYFRARVVANIDVFSNSIFVLIDKNLDGAPEYSFTWDAKSNDVSKHGLEFQAKDTVGTTWATTQMKDNDNDPARKTTGDFALPPGTDGYVLTADNQAGSTTFIDFAVKWSFLAANSTLAPGQTWKIQFGSIDNKTDHNNISTDVAGNKNPANAGLNWSNPVYFPLSGDPAEQNGTPEPATVAGFVVAALGIAARRMKTAA